jgi:hypothetical protein
MRTVGAIWSATLLILLTGCATSAPRAADPGFAHLERSGSGLRTTGDARLEVRAPPGFRIAGPSHRRAEFSGHPYEVSLGAVLGADEAVMVHGERVADASGASNYDELPLAGWPGPAWRIRSFCLDVPASMVAEEHDLGWLRDHGWDPAGTVAMDQYLATSADHNREAVLSLIVRNVDCADQPKVKAALAALRSKLKVRLR